MKYEIKTDSGGPLKKNRYEDKRTTGSESLSE